MAFDLGSLLNQYLGGNAASPQQAEQHFDQVAQNAPAGALSSALSGMFRSDQTPAFGQMAGQMFGQANPNQQAGMLNGLIAGLGPTVLASLAGGAASGGLGSILGKLGLGNAAPAAGQVPSVTPDQASRLSPQDVQVIAAEAEKHNPGVIDQMSSFYAQHPTLVKTVGGAALAIALGKLAEAQRS